VVLDVSASLIGRIVGMAFLSGARPFLTIAMAQVIVMLAVYAQWVSLHPDYAALLSWPVVAAVFALAVIEVIVAHDEDADEIKRLAQLDKVGGVAATAYGTLLMFAIGEPVPESVAGFSGATASLAVGGPTEVASLVEQATGVQHPLWAQGLTVLGAATFTLGVTWIRGRILEWLTDVGLDGLWHLGETGGVPLAVVLVLLAPVVMLVFVVAATLLMAVLAIGARVWQRHADERARVACVHCGHRVRGEASLCPHCRGPLTPQRLLGQRSEAVPARAPVPAA
jgi:hypothetical protein